MRPHDLPPAEHYSHGVRARYVCGCRCDGCRDANRRYANARARAIKAGDWNGLVPAVEARAHLWFLSDMSVGRRAVASASGVATSTLQAIRNGTKTQLRQRTERKILSVTTEAIKPHALVPAEPTWERINQLRQQGWKKAHIAIALGKKTPALQIRVNFITAKTEYDVRELVLTALSKYYGWH